MIKLLLSTYNMSLSALITDAQNFSQACGGFQPSSDPHHEWCSPFQLGQRHFGRHCSAFNAFGFVRGENAEMTDFSDCERLWSLLLVLLVIMFIGHFERFQRMPGHC